MTDQPPEPPEPTHGYPAAPPPPPPPPTPQGGWGDTTAPGVPGGYAAPAPYADWIKRVGAYLVDVAVLVPAYVVAAVGLAIAGTGEYGDANMVGVLISVIGYVAVFAVAIWNLIIRQGRTGWSVGKQVIGIRLIGERTGQPIGPGLTFVRWLAHILDGLPCYLGYLWPLWDPKRQTFADKIMSTVVIEQKRA